MECAKTRVPHAQRTMPVGCEWKQHCEWRNTVALEQNCEEEVDIDEEECLQWLDSRPSQSVVFVCLGSQFILNDKQICALATGLEASRQAFVWAIKLPQTEPKLEVNEVEVGLHIELLECRFQ